MQTGKRRSPEFSEREPPNSGTDAPEELMEQVIYAHTISNNVIMNWKRTLLNQIIGLGVEHLHQPDLSQAGRLANYMTNWSAIT